MAPLAMVAGVVGGVTSLASGVIGMSGARSAAESSLLGGQLASQGALQAGVAARDAAYYRAAGLRQNAQEERAAGQRDAIGVQTKKKDLQSTLRAKAAASGGAADPTVMALSDQIETAGSVGALTEMYKGENRARGLVDSARGEEISGDAALTGAGYRAQGATIEAQGRATGSMYQGYASMLNGASSMFDRFGRTGRRRDD